MSHHYYQVYYKVRDEGIVGLNRFFPPENDTPENTRDIPIKDAPPLSASVITKRNPAHPALAAYITPLIDYLKKSYVNEPFVRGL